MVAVEKKQHLGSALKEEKTSDPGAFIYSLDEDLQRFMTKKLPA